MTPGQAARQIEIEVRGMVLEINRNAISRATRGVNLLRSAAFAILGKDGTGRRYGRHVASAPGQPPAPDTGNLRRNWRQRVLAQPNGHGAYGVRIKMQIKSDTFYAKFLEHGTIKMAPRPFKERIKTKARPKIVALFSNL